MALTERQRRILERRRAQQSGQIPDQPVQTQVTERQSIDVQPQQQAVTAEQQVVSQQKPQLQQQVSDIPIDITQGQQFVQGIGQPRGDFDPRSQADLLGLRTLVGMAETPESQLATVRARTGDPQARFTAQVPRGKADITFTDPKTGKEVGLMRETGLLGDVVEDIGSAGRPVAKTLGAAAIAAMGLGADLFSGSEGLYTAVGAAAGEELMGQAFDAFARSVGVVDPRGTLEQLGRAGEEVALDVLLPAVLEPFAKAPLKLKRNFVEAIDRRARKQAQEKFSPNEELYDALIESGLEDPTGAWGLITGNETVKRELQALQTLPSGKKFKDNVDKFINFAEGRADNLEALSDSTVIDKEVAGKRIKEFASAYDRASADFIDSARKKIKGKTGSGDIPINNTLPFIIGEYEQWRDLPSTGKLIYGNDVLNSVMRDISSKVRKDPELASTAISSIDDVIEAGSENIDPYIQDTLSKGFDLDKLLSIRSDVLRREREMAFDDPRKIGLIAFSEALNKDIKSSLASDPALLRKFERTNKQYALRKKVFNEQLSKFVRQRVKGNVEVSNDQAFKAFLTKAKTGPSEINKIYKKMPLSAKDDISNVLISEMVSDPRTRSIRSNNFDPSFFLRKYKEIPEGSKEIIFSHKKGLKEELDQFASIMDAFQANQRFRNNSGTGITNYNIDLFRNPKEFIFNYLLDMPGVRRINPAYMTTRLMTNKDFLRWATKGGERPRKGLSSIDAVFKGLPEVIKRNPDIRSDVLQFMRGMASFYDEQAGRENIRQSQPQTPAAGDRRIGIQQAPLVVPNQGRSQNRRQFRPQQAAEMMGVKG